MPVCCSYLGARVFWVSQRVGFLEDESDRESSETSRCPALLPGPRSALLGTQRRYRRWEQGTPPGGRGHTEPRQRRRRGEIRWEPSVEGEEFNLQSMAAT